MRQLTSFLILFLLLTNCSNTNTGKKEIYDFIPENTAIIIKSKSFETLETDIKNNNIISRLSKASFLDSISKKFHQFDSLKLKNEALICISNTNDISYITKLSKDFTLDSTTQKATRNLHKTITDSIVFASTSKTITNQLKTTKPQSAIFKKLYKTFNDSPLTVFINQNNLSKNIDSLYQNNLYNLKGLSNWMAFDATLEQEELLLNGVSVITDTLPKLLNVFKNTTPSLNQTAKFVPVDTDGFISLSFNNFDTFNQNLKQYNSTTTDSTQIALFKNIYEIGIIYNKNATALVLQTNDIIETKDALLSEQSVSSTFRQTNIFNFSQTTLFNTVLNPFVIDKINQYTILNDVLIFSNDESFLKTIITNYQNKSVLATTNAYKILMEHLSSQSSLLMVANNQNFKSVWAKNTSLSFKNQIKKLDLNNYPFSAIQFAQDKNFLHTNAYIRKNNPKAQQSSITEQFNIVLDDAILNTPQFVKNHLTSQKEIVVQDIKNNLYLISNKGKVLWKKQINGNILGKIEQIDMYKNGRLQLAFATPNRVYVIDRNGKDVSPFPLKFNDQITQPLSVFDYNNNKNYRLLVIQGKNTLMYNAKGNRVTGFKFNGASKNINSQAKHFRVNSKDYIVFSAGNKLYILNRTGQIRVPVKETFNFSDNQIHLYNNMFCFTNTKGQLVEVNQKGQVAKQNLLLPKNHNLTTTSKTLVTLAGNKLTIKSKTIELDFGNYTEPEIFYLNDKIYVAVTDLQTQKVYLFDSQTKKIANFPVYGNSTLELDNVDGDRNLEFVVKGDEKSLILYQIN